MVSVLTICLHASDPFRATCLVPKVAPSRNSVVYRHGTRTILVVRKTRILQASLEKKASIKVIRV